MSAVSASTVVKPVNEGFGTRGPAALSAGDYSRRHGAGPNRHPVLAALPPEVRLAIYRRGYLREVRVGDRLGEGVAFILSGAVALLPGVGAGVCLGLAGPGSVVNVESLVRGPDRECRVLVSGSALILEPSSLWEILGRDRAGRLLIEQLLVQQAALEREAVCHALHPAGARLARWLLMLYDAAGGGQIYITQAALADMLGVQRTSVNAAARTLQDCGALKFVRGRVRILNPAAVRALACGCADTAVGRADEPTP